MSNIKTKLTVEYTQLKHKYNKLCVFLNDETQTALIDSIHLQLLTNQRDIMKEYIDVLHDRCKLLGFDPDMKH